jgi:NAD(P)-dependent dehydrogenase (short-subunit alcohol dehydrogenase family)
MSERCDPPRGLAVLGAAGGIGRDLCEAAAARGWRVAALDLPASLERHAPAHPSRAVDATDAAALDAAADWAAEAVGPLGGFVNLAGFMSAHAPAAEVSEATFREVIEGNLTGTFLAARAFAPRLADGGAMVFAGSGLGHMVRPGFGPYGAAKAAIAQMAKQLALEWAPRLRVNCVAPSAVDTAFLRGGTGRSDENAPIGLDFDAYAPAVPMKRIAQPRDVSGPILFLLSRDAAYVTGQTLHVNGGTFMP